MLAPVTTATPPNPQPYRCPVCNGRQTVPASLYSPYGTVLGAEEPCRSCLGTGIVWR